jgi:hypothetical protein
MGPLPLDPQITPRIELNHKDPVVFLQWEEDWTCPDCGDHYCIEQEGQERICLICSIRKTGTNSTMILGWVIIRTPNQIVVRPPAHRVDGN